MMSGTKTDGKNKTGKMQMNSIKAKDFVKKSVLKKIKQLDGVDEIGAHHVKYHAKFFDGGLISLAASEKLIQSVVCKSGGLVHVEFAGSVAQADLPGMFPPKSLLVIDGVKFLSCNFDDKDTEPLTPSGFLIIEKSKVVDDVVVTITGTPVSFNYVFKEKDLLYEEAEDRTHLFQDEVKLRAFKQEFPNKESPFKVAVKVEPSADIGFKLVREHWKLNPFDFPDVDFTIQGKMGLKIKITGEITLRDNVEFERNSEFPFVPYLPIPNAGISLPQPLMQALNLVLPSDKQLTTTLGVGVEMPLALNVDTALGDEFKYTTEVAASFGEEFYKVSVNGPVSGGLSPYKLDFERQPESKGFDFEFDKENLPTNVNPVGFKGDAKFDLFFGFKPKIVIGAAGKA
ncbi:hypothetical protein ACA910_015874 [Epithemia clementina (nom. ined.)]